jgi:hypothetical protein
MLIIMVINVYVARRLERSRNIRENFLTGVENADARRRKESVYQSLLPKR